MKTVVVVLLLLAVMVCRKRHSRRNRKRSKAVVGGGCGIAAPAHSMCNIEGIDYKEINYCGCKYRGEDCNNYNYFMDPADTTNKIMAFYP